ncbi:Zinc uptake regulation protein Zur [Olavius algarvensis associated proteobacterium Delta 3]|nr:Zinc uptake regulation protein Zur [Olavius algarvensis associated proteobacterium Delta 3]
MCRFCDYPKMLEKVDLQPTPKRLKILEIIGGNDKPLSAQDIFKTINRTDGINRVTVYRILDLLVENGLAERISTGGRSFNYGMAPNDHHSPHPHFYCTRCGGMECLNPESLTVDPVPLLRMFPGRIDSVEVRVDGICDNCLRTDQTSAPS